MNRREWWVQLADRVAVGYLVGAALTPVALAILAACGRPAERLAEILIAQCVIVAACLAWLSRGGRR